MGRKKNKLRRLKQQLIDRSFPPDFDEVDSSRLSGKQLGKKQKKLKKLSMKQVTITKEHRWYLVKVYDTPLPSKSFLTESFKSLVDSEFMMLGYYQSTNSARFFLENNTCAAMAIKALHKRMQGSTGKVMHIQVEPCQSFLILNAQQMITVKETLMRRYNAALNFLELSAFHLDPTLVEQDVLPVLSDPAIFRQVLVLVRDNFTNMTTLSLSRNCLRLASVRVMCGTLTNCPLQRINLESNEIENVKEVVSVLSRFELQELKLHGNSCLNDIKNPTIYIRTVRSQLPQLKTLDGQDISGHVSAPVVSASPPELMSSLNTSLASTSLVGSEPTPVYVNEPLVQKFLAEFYTCIDSEQRTQLVHAYLTNAKFAIESHISVIPSGTCEGSENILKALQSLPAFIHAKETFSLKVLKLLSDQAEIAVSGQLQVAGHHGTVSFVHTLTVVPYNTGLGISHGIMGFRKTAGSKPGNEHELFRPVSSHVSVSPQHIMAINLPGSSHGAHHHPYS
ncbi:Nuclear transport factor 2 [Trinorchestia longiramus]|nr:Nuclear transport factor 2 [Trinorchestia longiramus]